jgi:hypothetical protein
MDEVVSSGGKQHPSYSPSFKRTRKGSGRKPGLSDCAAVFVAKNRPVFAITDVSQPVCSRFLPGFHHSGAPPGASCLPLTTLTLVNLQKATNSSILPLHRVVSLPLQTDKSLLCYPPHRQIRQFQRSLVRYTLGKDP